MIITHLHGGLGNQMFQYAFGRHLSLKNNTNLIVDDSLISEHHINKTVRHYQLGKFNIKADYIKNLSIFNKISIFTAQKLSIHQTYREKKYEFSRQAFNLGDNYKLIGYWQSYRYFEHIKEKIIKELAPINTPNLSKDIKKVLLNKNTVSIHVRRGDYVTNKGAIDLLGALPISYYKKAISYIEQCIKNPHYIVISDDINWCKKNLKNISKKSISFYSQDSISDFYLMTQTKHNIAANSTFSWWGAYLNQNPYKQVVVPKNWFKDKDYTTKDLFKPEWKQL